MSGDQPNRFKFVRNSCPISIPEDSCGSNDPQAKSWYLSFKNNAINHAHFRCDADLEHILTEILASASLLASQTVFEFRGCHETGGLGGARRT
ncbi:hypothetical protein [Sinorhizobium mexicanum]|uniref:Uncharacterized protein n=1 Tax=Sinorhizobium mexicanum TaxID=375549 RepID=A0A859QH91_9HYPH|nr:hypothetical protein [Sinorhizobium mexicanum]MBP1883864.1 hypothetical protein [Sinorhizobium mexicanum]QLL66173.1 hypothetical protein FKV68_33540 [Sinorhizobium mexicanum]